jgi:hypothetical protein
MKTSQNAPFAAPVRAALRRSQPPPSQRSPMGRAAANDATRTRTLVDDIALDAGWRAGWRRVVTPVLEPHCPGEAFRVRARRPPPQRAGAALWAAAMGTGGRTPASIPHETRRRTTRPGTRTLVEYSTSEGLPGDGPWAPSPLTFRVRTPYAPSPPTMRRPSANAPQRASASRWMLAMGRPM